ncbi:trichothecene 3-o-acetyltransferase [Fusarium beomiforme]|uniref:Trichothecene 3-o-acetyltransferase n=1 Tax=Fusarium beomiforme TaxID=44412 RepID=A0A9P5A415_9HYPO|nr:trichothecene 3-o-acetyltransferase [Fusarium beomiforme]
MANASSHLLQHKMLDLNIKLEPLTNRLYPGEYQNLSLVFDVDDDLQPYADLICLIQDGLIKLSKQFPWVTGQVIWEQCKDGNRYSIIPFQTVPRMQIEDRRTISELDFSEVKSEEFVMDWINQNHVPIKEPWVREHYPVMELKFTLEGQAAILTISGHSKVMDITGLDMIIRMLAKACRRKYFSPFDISAMEISGAFLENEDKVPKHERRPVSFATKHTMDIGSIAMDFRKSVQPTALREAVTHFFWNLSTIPDNPKYLSAAVFDPAKDVAIVSWTRAGASNPDYIFNPNWHIQYMRVP